MDLQTIKKIVSTGWVLTVLAVAIISNMSWPVQLALAAVGLLPPLALLLSRNEPSQMMSGTINQARR